MVTFFAINYARCCSAAAAAAASILQVNAAELEQVIDKLVRPCTLLRSERKQRQERQEAAAAAVQRAESSKEFMMQKMEALHRSKASNFLEAISRELRRRRLQIRDVFQAVEQGRSGSLGERYTTYSLEGLP